ncbi:MAG: hypothetical protein FWG87_08415 [Defluviitaleaceae bacterium]|nr:hypothetical protein [Defluviitaleaceae bacterium]
MNLKRIKHGFNGFTQIYADFVGIIGFSQIFPRANPLNPRKSAFHRSSF